MFDSSRGGCGNGAKEARRPHKSELGRCNPFARYADVDQHRVRSHKASEVVRPHPSAMEAVWRERAAHTRMRAVRFRCLQPVRAPSGAATLIRPPARRDSGRTDARRASQRTHRLDKAEPAGGGTRVAHEVTETITGLRAELVEPTRLICGRRKTCRVQSSGSPQPTEASVGPWIFVPLS